MDLLDKQIIRALKVRRQELFAELESVNKTLTLFEPVPRPARPLEDNQKRAIMALLEGSEKTTGQIARTTGLSPFIVGKRLQELRDGKYVMTVAHGNVTHWRKRKQYANVRAGYGVVAGSA